MFLRPGDSLCDKLNENTGFSIQAGRQQRVLTSEFEYTILVGILLNTEGVSVSAWREKHLNIGICMLYKDQWVLVLVPYYNILTSKGGSSYDFE